MDESNFSLPGHYAEPSPEAGALLGAVVLLKICLPSLQISALPKQASTGELASVLKEL